MQLIVRQGTDSTRQNVVLKSGELGYTTDTKKLYVGDGTTLGGALVGKTYAGSATNITTLSPAFEGDLAFDTDNNKLYRLQSSDGSDIGDWELIGGVYSANDTTLTFTADNKVAVGTISGSNISPNALANPIHLNGSNQIALSAKVTLDEIVPRAGDSVKIPSKLQIGSNTFTFSNESYADGDVFYINGGEVVTRSPATINDAVSYISTQNLPISSERIGRENIKTIGRLIGRNDISDVTYTVSLSDIGKTLMCGIATSQINGLSALIIDGGMLGIHTSFSNVSVLDVSNITEQISYTFGQYECDGVDWNLIYEIPL